MSLQDFGERWLDAGGVRTRYFDSAPDSNGPGAAPPIVFIHGGQMGDASGGENAEDWDMNFRPLAQTHRVIAIDRLGQGYTDNPTDDADCTMAGAVRHATQFLQALGAGPYNLVGHSRGGYITGAITLANPELANACIIVDSASAGPGEGRNDIVFCTNPHPPGTLDSSRFVYEGYSCTFDHISDAWLAMKQKITDLPKNREMIARMNDHLMAARFMPDFVADRDSFFAQIENDGFRRPVLLVWGYNDPTAPLQMGLDLFDKIAMHQPRTGLHVFNKAGHFSFRERPEEFNRVISEFFEGVAHGD